MDDIAPKLIENVNKDFADNLAADKNATALSEKLAAGQARYEDAYKYAESVGNARAKAFEDQISPEVLPEGKMHYNIASRLMTDSLTTDHEMIADYAAGVQKAYNEEAGINLKALKADVNEDRIDGFVERLSSEDVFDDVSWILQEPVVTHARSVVDDTIKKNAEFQGRAGIKATVIRNADPKCCKWCSDLAGDYVYPSVPREVFQRHDHCRCTVDYKGRRLSAYNSGGNRGSHTFRDMGENEKINNRKQVAQQKQTSINVGTLSQELAQSGIKYNPVSDLPQALTEQEIIDKLAGGDMTKGSCASLGFAYAGNKAGYDVTDFRGGKSQDFFSSEWRKIAKLDGVVSTTTKVKKEAAGTWEVLQNKLEKDKEYILSVGSHIAVVKNTEKGVQYLELQSELSGWKSFNNNPRYRTPVEVLQKRFGCRKTVDKLKYSKRIIEKEVTLIDVDSFKKSKEFKHVLGYLNTPANMQKKGLAGGIK